MGLFDRLTPDGAGHLLCPFASSTTRFSLPVVKTPISSERIEVTTGTVRSGYPSRPRQGAPLYQLLVIVTPPSTVISEPLT